MSLAKPICLLLAASLALSGCVQSPAPIFLSAPERAPAPAAHGPDAEAADAAPNAGVAAVTAADAGPSRTFGSAVEAELAAHDLILPVAGVSPDHLEDSFNAPREGGREHHAIDIMAPRGTPVLAADNGRVLRVSSNTLGGLTVYTIDRSGQFVYYYAHLEGYARGLKAGNIVFKGDTLGFVGTTGDAPDNVPHLHFQILRMPPNGKYWEGDPIDPFPLLSGRGASIVGNH
jgi:peptidoglycan LD-endopeptidase LytH